MGRSVKKGPFTDVHLMVKVQAAIDKNEKKVIRPGSRRSTVRPEFRRTDPGGAQREEFIPVYVTENMVGHKLGEFSPTPAVPGALARAATERRGSRRRGQLWKPERKREYIRVFGAESAAGGGSDPPGGTRARRSTSCGARTSASHRWWRRCCGRDRQRGERSADVDVDKLVVSEAYVNEGRG